MAEGNNDLFTQQPKLEDLIPLNEAAQISGLSHGHLALLIRRGTLWGTKIGRDWLTTKKAVLDYLASNPKPGPKPKKPHNIDNNMR